MISLLLDCLSETWIILLFMVHFLYLMKIDTKNAKKQRKRKLK